MPNVTSLQSDSRRHFQQACLELQQKLQAGEISTAEKVLTTRGELATDPDFVLALVLEEVRQRESMGQSVKTQEYLDRFPQLRNRLQETFRTRSKLNTYWLPATFALVWLIPLMPLLALNRWFLWEIAWSLAITSLFLTTRMLVARRGRIQAHDAPVAPDDASVELTTLLRDTVLYTAQATAPPATLGRLGQYDLLEMIGEGGMGVVYKSRHMIDGSIYALKTLKSGARTGEEVERFIREAREIAGLDHANIVRVFQPITQDNNVYYFTMAFMAGGSLARRRSEFALPHLAVALMAKVARAVHHAHDKGIIHRDLKPGNILLDDNNEPHVSDFGLAKRIDGEEPLTRTGAALGTMAYASPEQTRGDKDVSKLSDVWSLGVVLYELLTSQRPFGGDTNSAIKRSVQLADPEPPVSFCPEVDRVLSAIILKCLRADPAQRYASALALAMDLDHWLNGEPTEAVPENLCQRSWRWMRQRRGTLAGAAATLLLATGTAALGVWWPFNMDTAVSSSAADDEGERLAAEELERMQQELKTGEPMSLLGDDGLPRWNKRARMGTVTFARSHGSVRKCSLSSWEPALLELMPEPPASFVLRAKVLLANSDHTAQFGLCVAMAERGPANAREYYLCTLVLTMDHDPKDATQTLGCFRLIRAVPAFGTESYRKHDMRVAGISRDEHDLAFHVSGGRIEAKLDETPLGSISFEELCAATRFKLGLGVHLQLGSGAPVLPDEDNVGPLDFKSVLAIYSCDANADIRDITIQAYPAEP